MMGGPTQAASILQPGERAPSFTLATTPTETVSLADYLGRPVILVFYPADWSPDCADQLVVFNELLEEFATLGAGLIAISGDNVYSHMAFTQARNFHFPLLSDYLPRGAVGRQYGVFDDEAGMNHRALFVLDAEGIIRWSYVSPHRSIVPGADGILIALESLPENAGRPAR